MLLIVPLFNRKISLRTRTKFLYIPVCLLAFILAGAYNAHAQLQGQELIDSLENAATTMKDDSNKVKTYSRISQVYYSLNLMKSFAPAQQALALAEKIKWKRGIANINNNLGLFISDTGNYELGNKHYTISLELNKELGSKPNQVNNLNNIGRNYLAVSDFSNAADYFFQALTVAEALKSDEHIALVGTNLISCFYRQKNYPKAIEYGNLTIKHARLANNGRHLVNGLMQLGATRLELKDTVTAKQNLLEALKICEETNNVSDMANVLLNLAVAIYPDYQQSVSLMLRVDSIISVIAPGSGVDMNNNFTMADVYHKLSQQHTGSAKKQYLQKATARLQKARSLAENKMPEMMTGILLLESDLQEDEGDFKAALASFKASTAVSDSLFSQDKKNEIAGLEGKHDLAIRDKEIALNKLVLESQRKTQWALVSGLALLVVIGALLYRQSRLRKKSNTTLTLLNKELDEANKVKARFFGILSHDLRSPVVNLVHFLELQKNDPHLLSEADKQEHQQEISDAAEGLLNTMEAMLLWSKEQMESFKPNIREVAVEELFEQVGAFFGPRQTIGLQFIAEPGLTIMADENYLRTIMQNLTSNAIRAVRDIPDAAIVWEVKDAELSITDNGPGISPEKAKALFETGTVTNERNGLGLHLVRDLAKAIGYKIRVESEPGKGAKFVLSRNGEAE